MLKEFKVSGMHCESCVKLIKMDLEELPGIKEINGDWNKGSIKVNYDEKKTSDKEIAKKIEGAGYKVTK